MANLDLIRISPDHLSALRLRWEERRDSYIEEQRGEIASAEKVLASSRYDRDALALREQSRDALTHAEGLAPVWQFCVEHADDGEQSLHHTAPNCITCGRPMVQVDLSEAVVVESLLAKAASAAA